MNIVTPLIPVAAAALDTVVQGVGSALQKGSSFAHILEAAVQRDSTEQGSGSTVGDVLPVNASERGEQVKLGLLRRRFESLRQSVHQQISERFAADGIDLSEPSVLELDADGRLLETSGHWDRAQIEQLLESDASLREAVTQLLETGEQLNNSMLDNDARSGASGRRAGRSQLVVSARELLFQVS